MLCKLLSGAFHLCSRKRAARTGKRRHLATFARREAAEARGRAVQSFKRHG